ncbi:uncharacterized protein LOC119784410 [Cyprinodon tularosa]|uniref:uncharacterized protein LOC119784410 n=1 Tax=Cyprinodon tularosa TaxID=77115 RepID=UPI0018E25AA4|nr:uncharacterized protein LOC119784410 [Cyprinodon tularosa]
MVKNRICRKSKTHRKVLKAVEKMKKEKRLKKKSKQQTPREPDQILGLPTSDALPVRSGMVSDSPILPLEAFNPVISSQRFQPASDGWLLPVSSSLPPRAMMDDYAAATPRSFPHTCSLCSQVCSNIQEWIFHQNISFHLENCKLLRKRYPNWDCTVPLFKSIRPGSRSRSRNESQSGHSSVEDGWDRPRSRSRSPSPYCSNVLGAGWRSGEDLNSQR